MMRAEEVLAPEAAPEEAAPKEVDEDLYVFTAAGTGHLGSLDGDGATTATFAAPGCVLPLPDGSLLVADTAGNCLRRLRRCATGWLVSHLGTSRGWLAPRGLALMPGGAAVLVCDTGHNKIRLLDWRTGRVSAFAGSGRRGHRDAAASVAEFDSPEGVCVCANGTVLVADVILLPSPRTRKRRHGPAAPPATLHAAPTPAHPPPTLCSPCAPRLRRRATTASARSRASPLRGQ